MIFVILRYLFYIPIKLRIRSTTKTVAVAEMATGSKPFLLNARINATIVPQIAEINIAVE